MNAMRFVRTLSFLLCLALVLTAVGCAEGTPSGGASSAAASKVSSAASVASSIEEATSGDASSGAASETVSDAASADASSTTATSVSDASSTAAVSSQAPVVYKETVYDVAGNTDKFHINGRTMAVTAAVSKKQGMIYDHAGQAFCFIADCEGDVTAQIEMKTQNVENKYDLSFIVRVDGAQTKVTLNGNGSFDIYELPIAKGLSRGEHVFEIYRCNEAVSGLVTLMSVTMTGAPLTYQAPQRDLKMVFLGDSVTCGSGLDGSAANSGKNILSDATRSYAFLCGEALNADFYIAGRSGTYTAKDDSPNSVYYTYDYISRRRSTALYDNTKDDVDVFVISLGSNDTNSTNNFPNDKLRDGIQALITRVRADHPNAKIVWTYGQLSATRESVIKGAVQEMMATDSNLFYYKYRYGNNQGGAWHPTAAAHARDAKELTDYIRNTVLNRGN